METKQIYKKMVDVMKEIGAVGKNQTNTSQGFKFRGIDQFVNALYPALTKHGVFMTAETRHVKNELKEVTRNSGKQGYDKHVELVMRYTFHAEDGSSVFSDIPSEGLDSGDKATNKALSSALKYALIQTFSIPTEDMEEADRYSPELSLAKATAVFNGGLSAATAVTAAPTETPAPAANGATKRGFRRLGETPAPVTKTDGENW